MLNRKLSFRTNQVLLIISLILVSFVSSQTPIPIPVYDCNSDNLAIIASSCIEKNINCYLVDSKIDAFDEKYLYVGNAFSYEVDLKQIYVRANTSVSFTVELYQDGEQVELSKRTYELAPPYILTASGDLLLKPFQDINFSQLTVFKASKLSTYELRLYDNSSNARYYTFYSNCRYTSEPQNYSYYFDSLPRWQSNVLKAQDDIVVKQMELADKTVQLTAIISDLTYWLLLLAVIQAVLAFILFNRQRSS